MWKKFLMASFLLSLLAGLAGAKCPDNGGVKVYNLDPERGIERAQDEELIPFSQIPPCTVGQNGEKSCKYAALSWEDVRTILERLARCSE